LEDLRLDFLDFFEDLRLDFLDFLDLDLRDLRFGLFIEEDELDPFDFLDFLEDLRLDFLDFL